MKGLADQRVFISGGCGDIGKAVATRFLDAGALKGARIGVWHSYDPDVADPATVAIFKAYR